MPMWYSIFLSSNTSTTATHFHRQMPRRMAHWQNGMGKNMVLRETMAALASATQRSRQQPAIAASITPATTTTTEGEEEEEK